MSKTSRENKLKEKANGKQATTKTVNAEQEKTNVGKCKNYGFCCTCVHYPKHASNGLAQKCKVLKNYVGRKVQHPECYKCKH